MSKRFYQSSLPALKGISFRGGVTSNTTTNDQHAFAALLDYLTHRILVTVMYAALCPDVTSDTERLFKNATALLSKKREKSAHYKETLMSVARRSDRTP